MDEYKRLGEGVRSETSDLILGQLAAKMRGATELEEKAVARCMPTYQKETLTFCTLQRASGSRAVLVTNDRDFDSDARTEGLGKMADEKVRGPNRGFAREPNPRND